MMTKFESRFMRVATMEEPCQMSEDELKEEFERFQEQAIDLLMSDAGYLAIDFTLNDLHTRLDSVTQGKKILVRGAL